MIIYSKEQVRKGMHINSGHSVVELMLVTACTPKEGGGVQKCL